MLQSLPVGFTQHLVSAVALSQEQSMIPFGAARDFQLSAYRLGVTYGRFLPGLEIFLRVFNRWVTLYQWCPEESATETV